MQEYWQAQAPPAILATVRVIEERDLSRELARRLGVVHESPQVILVRDGQARWHASHWEVTPGAVAQALAAHGGA